MAKKAQAVGYPPVETFEVHGGRGSPVVAGKIIKSAAKLFVDIRISHRQTKKTRNRIEDIACVSSGAICIAAVCINTIIGGIVTILQKHQLIGGVDLSRVVEGSSRPAWWCVLQLYGHVICRGTVRSALNSYSIRIGLGDRARVVLENHFISATCDCPLEGPGSRAVGRESGAI